MHIKPAGFISLLIGSGGCGNVHVYAYSFQCYLTIAIHTCSRVDSTSHRHMVMDALIQVKDVFIGVVEGGTVDGEQLDMEDIKRDK